MRRLSLLSLLFIVFALSQSEFSQIKYETYINARFGYVIKYPAGILRAQPEAENGDGRIFLSKDKSCELRVWGQYNALSNTLRKAYLSDLKERPKGITYKQLTAKSYVISGVKGNKIVYQKTILSGQDGDTGAIFSTFTIEYAKPQKAKYDAIVRQITRSFKFD